MGNWYRKGRLLQCAITVSALLALASVNTLADGVVFPPGARLGFIPPPGLQPSRALDGFEDAERNVSVIFRLLPGPAYSAFVASISREALAQREVVLEGREDVTLNNGSKAILAAMHQDAGPARLHKRVLVADMSNATALVSFEWPDTAAGRYSEEQVRNALLSVTLRAEVSSDELLQILPFRIRDLSGMSVAKMLPGRAGVELTDAAHDGFDRGRRHMRIAVRPGTGIEQSERDRTARLALRALPPFNDLRILSTDELRLMGGRWHELRAAASDPVTAQPVDIVQWLRFDDPAGLLHIIAFATRSDWPEAFRSFRAVRDSIGPR